MLPHFEIIELEQKIKRVNEKNIFRPTLKHFNSKNTNNEKLCRNIIGASCNKSITFVKGSFGNCFLNRVNMGHGERSRQQF